MKKEDLVSSKEESVLGELHYAGSSTPARQVLGNENQSVEEELSESACLQDLVTSLDHQEKELTISQTQVQALLGETGELLSEYKTSVEIMKDKLEDRKTKLGKLKA